MGNDSEFNKDIPANVTALQARRTRDLVLDFFPPKRRAEPSVNSLASIFEDFIGAADLTTRLDAFAELKDWTTKIAPSPAGKGVTRLEVVLALMESQSELLSRFKRGMREILTEIRSVELFAEAGLHPREGLLSEAWRRLIERVLPSAREDTDLSKLMHRLYPTSQAIDRLIELPNETFERIARLISPVSDARAWAKQREDVTQAFYLLGVHVAGIGLSPALRARSHAGNIEKSPFYELQQTAVELVGQRGAALALESWRGHVQRCRDELAYVHLRLEDTGVSTALVFDMGTIEHAISRMEHIANVLFVAEEHESVEAVKCLLDDVLEAHRRDMSLLVLFRENSALMARKVVERTGKAGEPYIADSRSEYRGIWKASLGGGLLTVLTSALKMRIVGAHLPLFLEGMAAGTNYAVSFIVLQHFHLALATKQPSVTAATFAGIVRITHGQSRLERLAEFIRRITSSQLVSVAGNLLAVCLGCLVFAQLWALAFSRPFLEVRSAEYVYQTLNPLASGTMIYAALTGVILWRTAP
jgi:site-specific recombinase